MDQLERWLSEVGLEQHFELLRDAEVDLDILPDLTDADYASLGLSLGARKRLARAAALLDDEVNPTSIAIQATPLRTEPERRQLTVMFCDLVGSTELSEQFDPEDLGTILRAYQDTCGEIIQRHDGTIARYYGDGIMVYFGYPMAKENDAERAIRAALEIITATNAQEVLGVKTETRIGIATGPVVVGEVIGEGYAQEQAVVGSTPNLAARLQSLTTTVGVIVSDSTKTLAGKIFTYDNYGLQQLKGFEEPVQAWQAISERSIESRFEATRNQQQSKKLIGREEEVDRLISRWEKSTVGKGQIATLVGEAGIGKSRLVETIRSQVSNHALTEVRLFCAPGSQNTTLAPFTALIARAAQINGDDSDDIKLSKLEKFVSLDPTALPKWVPLYARLLSVPVEAIETRFGTLETNPLLIREDTLQALLQNFVGLASRRALLIVFEDLHWLDPTSQELLQRLGDQMEDKSIMVIATSRPEYVSPWPDLPYSAQIILNKLDSDSMLELIKAASGDVTLPQPLIEQVLAKADGVPLYAEELTRAVATNNSLFESAEELSGHELTVPSTLQDSLMARIDRMLAVKPIIQTAACIGRTFSWELIQAVTGHPEAELALVLDKLQDADIIRGRGTVPHATYSFKHALLQDAAYDSLLKSRRQELHGLIAEIIEERYPHRMESEPEVLALHWAGAHNYQKAISYSQYAGEISVSQSAYPEAVHHFSLAISQLQQAELDAGRIEKEIELRSFLGSCLIATRGYAAPEVGSNYQRALQLCDDLGLTQLRFNVLFGLWLYHLTCSERSETERLAQQIIELAKSPGHEDRQIASHFVAGITSSYRGEFVNASEQFERLLSLYDPSDHLRQMLTYSDDLGLFALVQLEWMDVLCGRIDQALDKEQRAAKLADHVSDAMSKTRSYIFAMMRRHDIRDVDACLEMAENAIELAKRHRFDMWHAIARYGLGWALAMRGDPSRGVVEIQAGLDFFEECGQKLPLTYWSSYLVEVHLANHETDEGLAVVERGLKMSATNVDSLYQPELLRLKGELLLLAKKSDDAETCFRSSLHEAIESGAELLALRSATSLARLLVDQNQPSEAREILAPRCAAVREGLETEDVQTATALLAKLT